MDSTKKSTMIPFDDVPASSSIHLRPENNQNCSIFSSQCYYKWLLLRDQILYHKKTPATFKDIGGYCFSEDINSCYDCSSCLSAIILKSNKKRIILYFRYYSKLKWVRRSCLENYGKGTKYLRNSRTFILDYH